MTFLSNLVMRITRRCTGSAGKGARLPVSFPLAGDTNMNKKWRMSFRCGNGGPKMWPQCFLYGVAAITYSPIEDTDLSQFSLGKPKELWDQLAPAQKASLKRVAYEMEAGDTIYVKEGKYIICKGKVLASYPFDAGNRIVDPYGGYWNHQVPVDWETDFTRTPILLGAEQFTVLPLEPNQVESLELQITENRKNTEIKEVMEGETVKAETTFRIRNRTIIAAKKAFSNGHCDVCNLNFKDKYGIDNNCLVAHHINPIGSRNGSSKTTIDDIVLLCPNCHAVAHTKEPPLPLEEMKNLIR